MDNQYSEVEENSSDISEDNDQEVQVESNFTQTPISIFPNPARDFINIDLGSIDGEIIQMGIFDIMGREVVKIASDDFDGIVQKDISQLPSGMYFLRVMNSEKEVRMKKFFVGN